MTERVVVGMSGGVDSAVCALLLRDLGYDVVGATLVLLEHAGDEADYERACCSVGAVEEARRTADQLGIEHHVFSYRALFRERVIAPFLAAYAGGRTPNPCVACNDHIKFAGLLRMADTLDATHVATGHYARIRWDDSGRWELLRGVDRTKDQSYFLYVLSQAELGRTLMPLGGMTKAEVRRLAAERGLRVATRPESQNLCFVGGDYRAYIAAHAATPARPGPIVDLEGREVGRHSGLTGYTVGQRRGLAVRGPGPWFVVAIDVAANALRVGPESALFQRQLYVARPREAAGFAGSDLRVVAKVRSGAEPRPATLERVGGGGWLLTFDEPQRAISPGQACVAYVDDVVIGGGEVDAAGEEALRLAGLAPGAENAPHVAGLGAELPQPPV